MKDLRSEKMMYLEREYVSRDDLRAMAVGQVVGFKIPANKLESAKGQCNNLRLKNMKFSTQLIQEDGRGLAIVKRIL